MPLIGRRNREALTNGETSAHGGTPVLIQGDARSLPLRDGCVQCVVTSPPYYGLRDYGTVDQIGLEATPDAYVEHLVQVFRELRRVLKDDGVAWLNLGDSYGVPSGGGYGPASTLAGFTNPNTKGRQMYESRVKVTSDVKPKDLNGIPWRVAFALQADGWYLRSDVIWAKPNPMPESVTDRPTKSHEYLFLLTKSERYYYDAAAIAEPLNEESIARYGRVEKNGEVYDPVRHKHGHPDTTHKTMHRAPMQVLTEAAARVVKRGTRNKRTVWTIPTMPYSGAHFATMPEKLVEPCILAGSRYGDLVLDPFSGSGTVLAVAQRLGRRAVGVDLNPAYHALAKVRTAQRGLRFERDSA